jgi:spoIIIJ-associated protein
VEAPAEEKMVRVSAEEQLARAENFLREVFAAMNLEVNWQQSESEEGVVFNLEGENLGILIGKHGQTLDSLQYLANLAANRGVAEDRVRVIIDIEGYRARREETLMRLAGHLAEKACRIGEEVHLEPMNRHERKIIHMALQDNRRVSTYSAGEEPRRYVVIVPRRRRFRRRDYEAQERYNED